MAMYVVDLKYILPLGGPFFAFSMAVGSMEYGGLGQQMAEGDTDLKVLLSRDLSSAVHSLFPLS